jgi:hypothetical protein
MKFCVFDSYIEYFKKIMPLYALFANFKAKWGRNGSKKQETYFIMCFKIIWHHQRPGRLHIEFPNNLLHVSCGDTGFLKKLRPSISPGISAFTQFTATRAPLHSSWLI